MSKNRPAVKATVVTVSIFVVVAVYLLWTAFWAWMIDAVLQVNPAWLAVPIILPILVLVWVTVYSTSKGK